MMVWHNSAMIMPQSLLTQLWRLNFCWQSVATFSAPICHEKCCTRCSSQFSPSSSLQWCCRAAAVAMKMPTQNAPRHHTPTVCAARIASASRMRIAVTMKPMALRWKMQSQPCAPPRRQPRVTTARITAVEGCACSWRWTFCLHVEACILLMRQLWGM